MNERLKALRKQLGFTQTEIGEKLGMSRDAIANLELGRVEFTELVIRHISRTLNISQEWFRSGEGDMFDAGGDTFDDVARQLNLNEFQRRLVQLIYEMPLEHQRIIRDYAVKLAEDEGQPIETEHERIERITNDYLDAYDAQPPGLQTDKRA